MKRRIWVWLLAGVTAVAFLVLGIFWDLRRKAADVLERHEKAAAAALIEIRARSWKRAPMFGSELPGNRWDAFTAALDALDAIPASDLDEIPAVRNEPGFTPNLEKLDAVFSKHRSSVDLLREACRRKSLVPPYEYEQGFSLNLPYLTRAMKAATYLAAAAERSHERGRDADAMDDLMLAFMVGQDQAFGGPLVNHLALIVCEHKAHELAQKVLADHGLTSKELETVAVSAERIWEARPRLSEALDIESVISRFQLAQLTMTSSAALGLPYPRHWRYGFSRDLMMAEALNEFEAFYRDAAALETVPLPERLSRAGELVKRVQRSRNPIAVQMLPGLGRSFRSEAGALMKWSLLRAALAIARYDADQGKLPSTLEELVPRYLPRVPEDPFSGKPLRYAGGKVWSFGGDGDDDQGRPQVNPDLEDSDGDVVWTVKRK